MQPPGSALWKPDNASSCCGGLVLLTVRPPDRGGPAADHLGHRPLGRLQIELRGSRRTLRLDVGRFGRTYRPRRKSDLAAQGVLPRMPRTSETEAQILPPLRDIEAKESVTRLATASVAGRGRERLLKQPTAARGGGLRDAYRTLPARPSVGSRTSFSNARGVASRSQAVLPVLPVPRRPRHSYPRPLRVAFAIHRTLTTARRLLYARSTAATCPFGLARQVLPGVPRRWSCEDVLGRRKQAEPSLPAPRGLGAPRTSLLSNLGPLDTKPYGGPTSLLAGAPPAGCSTISGNAQRSPPRLPPGGFDSCRTSESLSTSLAPPRPVSSARSPSRSTRGAPRGLASPRSGPSWRRSRILAMRASSRPRAGVPRPSNRQAISTPATFRTRSGGGFGARRWKLHRRRGERRWRRVSLRLPPFRHKDAAGRNRNRLVPGVVAGAPPFWGPFPFPRIPRKCAGLLAAWSRRVPGDASRGAHPVGLRSVTGRAVMPTQLRDPPGEQAVQHSTTSPHRRTPA